MARDAARTATAGWATQTNTRVQVHCSHVMNARGAVAYMSIEALQEVVQGIVCAKLDGLVQEEQYW